MSETKTDDIPIYQIDEDLLNTMVALLMELPYHKVGALLEGLSCLAPIEQTKIIT